MSLETIIKWLSGIMILSILTFGVYFSFQIFFWNDVYEEVPVEPKTITVINADTGIEHEIIYEKQELSKGKPFTLLLLGVDTNNMSYGRSDTIVLAFVQPEDKTVSLLSVPRDTYITNQKSGRLDKINHAYNNGITNTISSLENYFNIPIDYYATVNMQGFIKAVDTIGGLDVHVEKNLTFYDRVTQRNFSLKAGEQTLSGIETLNYARFRGDGEGDFGRNRRQRQVITEIIKQSTEFQNMGKLKDLLGILEENFRTNIKPLEMGVLLKQIGFGSDLTIEEINMEASTGSRRGMSVVLISEKEKERIIQELHEKLRLSENQ